MTGADGTGRGELSAEVDDFRRLLGEMIAMALWNGDLWRVPEDAGDRTYDQLVDRLLADTLPEDPGSWAWSVLKHRLRRGPRLAGLRQANVADVSEEVLAAPKRDPAEDTADSLEELREKLAGLKQVMERVLTTAERDAVHCLLESESTADAAAAAGMSERDLRTRRRRAIRKLRAILGLVGE